MSQWIDVCSVDDLVADAGICAWVGQRQIAIFSLPKINRVFAVDNLDPFSGAQVLSRGMVGDLGGIPMIASPMYKQHFNLETGQCFEDQTLKIAVYPLRIHQSRIEISF